MKRGLKLYVWENVLCDYTCGVMFSLARSEEEARELIQAAVGYDSDYVKQDLQQTPQVYDDLVGFAVYGGG